MRLRYVRHVIIPVLVILAGCSSAPTLKPPEVPAALVPPPGQTLYFEALATGVQIYECTLKADLTYEWAFKAPAAGTTPARHGNPATAARSSATSKPEIPVR